MQRYKSIWISDVHLGTNSCKAEQLCTFLKSIDCENLFIVGDFIDGWKLQRGWNWPQEHSNVIRRLLTKAKRGTNIFYIIGNHDEFLRSWLNVDIKLGNIAVNNYFDYVDSKGRKWFVTHGDQFDQVVRNWKIVSLAGDIAYGVLLNCNGLVNKVRRRLGLGYWSLSQHVKSKTKQAIDFIYKFEENLADHAKKQNCHGVICGHIHTPAIKMINGTVYINDGDWVETCSAIVETIDGEFRLLMLDADGQMKIKATY
jgi:UDP-2,3-diacylglucosamine pyrophosphatase LpxH